MVNLLTVNVITFCQLQLNGLTEFAEVLYYFRFKVNGEDRTLAMISLYGSPDHELYEDSYKTIWSVRPLGDLGVRVVEVKAIKSVVAMVPHQEEGYTDRFFVVEKPGLEMIYKGVAEGLEEA